MTIIRRLALLLLLLLAVVIPAAPWRRPATASPEPTVDLYVGSYESLDEMTPLDPATLADLPRSAPRGLGGAFVVSADGSTAARLVSEWTELPTIAVVDAPSGRERARFTLAEPNLVPAALSRDGARLVLRGQDVCSPAGCSEERWLLVDVRDGRELGRVEGDGAGIGRPRIGFDLIDADAGRLYLSFVSQPFPESGPGPWPLEIAAHDLMTGAEIAHQTLSDVPAGFWSGGRVRQVPIGVTFGPAVALSPDGARLAVVPPDGGALILIDAARLTVEAMYPIRHPRSVADRLKGLIPFWPIEAEAKLMEGRTLSAIFAPDGRHLYLFGIEATLARDADGNPLDQGTVPSDSPWPPAGFVERGLGLTAIDVDTGEIVAEALPDRLLTAVVPAPDGSGLYALGPTIPWSMLADAEPTFALVRLDAETLATLAERDFPSGVWVMVGP